MPTFQYTAQNASGKKVRGRLAAADMDALHFALKEKQLYLLDAQEIEKKRRVKMLGAKPLSDFSRQIGTLVGSGVTLVRALHIIEQQEGLKAVERRVYQELLRSVRAGNSLSEAMEKQNGVFPPLLIHMYHSAEVGGNLDRVAIQMAEHYDKEWRLSTKVRNATLYPKILAVLLIVVVGVIMAFVLPRFADMFAQMESLPLITRVLMAVSGFVQRFWYAVLAAMVGVALLLRWAQTVPSIRIQTDRLLVHLPFIGRLEKVIFTSRFARTLASLYCGGVPIVTSLDIARHTVGNAYIDKQFDDVIPFIRAGGNLSDGLSRIDGFANKLEFSARVGEETGRLDSMLESTADSMEYESEMALQRMVGYLEPAMIVIMAIAVGFVMLAVIVPIYSSYQTIGAA